MILTTEEILRRLVAFPTVSRDSNLPLIDWVRNFLDDLGIKSHLVPDPTGSKANLLATVGPLVEGGLVLSGHTDVVPVDGQNWSGDPFRVTARGTRLYGRGTCDMKGFIAVVLARAQLWRRDRMARPVHLMLSYDEEVGCLGTASMIAAAKEHMSRPSTVIVGEPTGLRLATEHKGIRVLRTQVRGIEAHSSLTHQGASAVMLAAELVAHLSKLAKELATRTRQSQGTTLEPPYTTLSANRICGGTASNILAAASEFTWDIRAVPGEMPQSIVDRLSAYAAGRLAELAAEGKSCHIETSILADVPPLCAENQALASQLLRSVTGASQDSISVPFATEAGYFQREGWSTVVCGPGSIDQAHKPDEYVERSQLADCEKLIEGVVARHCH